MPTRNINLTDRYDVFLTEQIENGRFKNASEAVRAALHLLEQRDLEDQAKLEALRRDIQESADAVARGEYTMLQSDDDIGRFFGDLKAEREATFADDL